MKLSPTLATVETEAQGGEVAGQEAAWGLLLHITEIGYAGLHLSQSKMFVCHAQTQFPQVLLSWPGAVARLRTTGPETSGLFLVRSH